MTTILVINPTSGPHRSQTLLYNFSDVERLLKSLHWKCQMKTRKSRTNITLFLNVIRDWVLPPITIEIIEIRRLQKRHFDRRYCSRCQHKYCGSSSRISYTNFIRLSSCFESVLLNADYNQCYRNSFPAVKPQLGVYQQSWSKKFTVCQSASPIYCNSSYYTSLQL